MTWRVIESGPAALYNVSRRPRVGQQPRSMAERLDRRLLSKKKEGKSRNLQICPFQNSANTEASGRRGSGVAPRQNKQAESGSPSANFQQNSPVSLVSPVSSPYASFAGHLRESVEDADKVIHKKGHSSIDSGHPWYVFRTPRPIISTPIYPTVHQSRDLNCLTRLLSIPYLQAQSDLWIHKRTPLSQNVEKPPAIGPAPPPRRRQPLSRHPLRRLPRVIPNSWL